MIQTPGVSQFFGCVSLGPLAWGITLAGIAAAVLLGPALASMIARVTDHADILLPDAPVSPPAENRTSLRAGGAVGASLAHAMSAPAANGCTVGCTEGRLNRWQDCCSGRGTAGTAGGENPPLFRARTPRLHAVAVETRSASQRGRRPGRDADAARALLAARLAPRPRLQQGHGA